MHYNLLEEKWIRVVTDKDTHEMCSITDIINNAHNYKDFDTKEYNNVKFPIYDYLLIRFLSTLASRVLYINEGSIKDILANQKFSTSEFEKYFNQWKDRFDLFDDEYPFMQSFQRDLVTWPTYEKLKDGSKQAFLSSNPTSPASSGRLFYTNISPDEFYKHKNPSDSVYVVNDTDNKSTIEDAIIKSLPIDAEQWAYIVLYNNSLVPGVGNGNKCALVGNSGYWEILHGQNLFETLVLNAPNAIKPDRFNNEWNIPLWEWDSIFDIYKKEDFGTLAGMFVPARIIRGYTDTGVLTKIIYSSLKAVDKESKKVLPYNDWLDKSRQMWAIKQEPHAIHKLADGLKEISNPYATLSIGADTWLLLIGEVGIADSGTIAEERQEIAKKDKQNFSSITPVANNLKAINKAILPQNVNLEIYYRICNGAKWTYQKTGKIVGQLPNGYFNEDSLQQKYILMMAKYIKNTAECLTSFVDKYIKRNKKTNRKAIYRVDLAFIDKLSGIFGIQDNTKGYISEIIASKNEDATKEIYKKYIYTVIETASLVFDKLYTDNAVKEFWETKKELINLLYKRGGLNGQRK